MTFVILTVVYVLCGVLAMLLVARKHPDDFEASFAQENWPLWIAVWPLFLAMALVARGDGLTGYRARHRKGGSRAPR